MKEIQIRLSGTGGQGLQLSAKMLAESLIQEGCQIAQSQSYEPTSRGGLSRADLVIGDEIPDYPLVTNLSALLIMDQLAAHASTDLIQPGGLVITDSKRVEDPPKGDFNLHALPLTETALKLGSARVANIIALGAMITLRDICKPAALESAVRRNAPRAFLELNIEALKTGFEMATKLS
ncbi:MAG: 2-oxoacid:acceptor oxidoreductase family protein [SAR324 cluster bacterium]|nr:2-oxoacid:acceptor oxidoreductase family protein [SAR324 cluster bacterium]